MGAGSNLNPAWIAGKTDWTEAQTLLSDDALLITANRRQAQALLLRYGLAQERKAWPRPAIEAWPHWLRQNFEEFGVRYNTATRLLEETQCEWLWQQVIDNDADSGNLLNHTACAQAARSAWQLVQDFAVTGQQLEQYPSAEAEAFIRWANQYARQLERLSAVDSSQLAHWLYQRLEAGEWQPPVEIMVYGFERWLPVQQELLEAIAQRGSRIRELVLPSAAQQVSVAAAIDPEQELLHAAQWARRHLLRTSDTGQYKVAIVVPDLHLRRTAVENALTTALHPNWDALQQPELQGQQLFDISAASTLADEPLMQLAFQWLALLPGRADFSVFSRLLRSPWFDPDEALARGRLEAHLRGMGLGQFMLSDIMQLAGLSEAAWHSPKLQSKLRALVEARADFNQRRPAAAWIQWISDLLGKLDWPLVSEAESAQPSTQLRRCWGQLLDQFNRLSPGNEPMPGSAVSTWLQRLARNIPVQQARPHARVHVLGLLEALGQRFDALWVTGLTAGQWPDAPQPNPLLPAVLQRQHQMPQSSPEQELQYARHATETLLATAPEVVFSYPLTQQDVNQQPSPLITALADIEKLPPISARPAWQSLWEQRELQAYADQQAPSLVDLSDDTAAAAGVTHGGIGVLKSQAQCPFQSLSQYRLKAQPLEPLRPGISPLQHGNCVHAVMQAFWQGFDPQKLPDKAARTAHLGECIEQVLAQNTIPCLRQPRLREAYSRYLQITLAGWLSVEAERPSGFTIQSLEQGKQLTIGPLRLDVRMDRIDRLGDGSQLVLDYKSGIGQPRQWVDERVSEPQLPLYALHIEQQDERVGGVVFANLHPQKTGFEGFTLQPDQLPGVSVLGGGRGELHKTWPEWPALRAMWDEKLRMLAQEHAVGRAVAEPVNPRVCEFCRRYSLCRIASADQDSKGDGDE